MEYLAGIMKKSGQHQEVDQVVKGQRPVAEYPEFLVQIGEDQCFIRPEEIIYLSAEGSYTRLHLTLDREARVSRKIKAVMAILDSDRFVRIHHSYVVNLQHVCSLRNLKQGTIQLQDKSELSLSRSRKADFLQRFKRL